ncbi:MAG TPA: hypothetical protein VJ111_15270 [Chitinophagaceae bacterium]|nr:hypothetical protein [Chitinophagaceae bacterium]
MTTTFSVSRLLQLVRKQWIENSRLYLFSILALLGILGLIMIFWIISGGQHYSEDVLYIIFLFGIYIAGAVFASMSFSMLGNKEKGTYWLAFPASHLEKLLCMIFYNVVVFTFVYCICFFLIKAGAVAYINSLIAEKPGVYTFRRSLWGSDRSFLSVLSYFIYGFFAVQAFYLLGSVYFPRYSFVITTIVGSALIFAFAYYSVELIQSSLNGYSWNGDHLRKYDGDYNTYQRYELAPWISSVLGFTVKFIWAPVFWIVAWFRLKEKQI